jgi:DNA polymerase I-like protein with 3'-5' exonuclease and polymerase domains
MQAVALTHKVPEDFLLSYEARRRELNKELGGTKAVHRPAKGHSLKVLAPYFLGVEPFWEVADHNNEEYAKKDARYTLELFHLFNEELRKDGTYEFYKTKLMPWARMLVRAEYHGVQIDNDLMDIKEAEAKVKAIEAKCKLDELWAEPYRQKHAASIAEIVAEYNEKCGRAVDKLKDRSKVEGTIARYQAKLEAAKAKVQYGLNIDSPAQLMWLLRDYYKLDVENFQEDESTGKSVLNRLVGEGRKDVEVLLEYRQASKLSSAFFPSYREMQWAGRIHAGFNLNGTRTGRLSASSPNLQQVPGNLHDIFIAGAGKKLICYDLAGIEPVVIAYLTEDPFLCDLLIGGGNFHSANVRSMLGIQEPDDVIKKKYKEERDLCKEVGLSLLYGASWRRIKESAQRRGFRWSDRECRDKYNRFREHYEHIYRFKEDLDTRLRNGEVVTNVLGRRFRIDDPEDVHMKGFNRLIQSSASDMLLESGRRASDEMDKNRAKPVLFVHDELITEAMEDYALEAEKILLKHLKGYKLETSYGLVPVEAEGGIFEYWKK